MLATNSTYYNNVISYINTIGASNVDFWSIGNEPDIWDIIHGDNTNNPATFLHTNFAVAGNKPTATDIALYVRTISKWIRQADPGCKILGPDLTWDNFISNSSCLFKDLSSGSNNIFSPTIVNNVVQSDNIDYYSFHYYPFPKYINGVPQSWIKQNVIDDPYFNSNSLFNRINGMRQWCITNAGNGQVQFALTEMNITTLNDPNADGVYVQSTDNPVMGLQLVLS
jgi:hypothetical protein